MNPPPERLPPEIGDSPPARIRGTAEINFIIDETGRARVPAIVEASDWDAALVALDDVADWRFAADVPEIELQLVAPPRSRTTWVLVREDQLYVPCAWPGSFLKQ